MIKIHSKKQEGQSMVLIALMLFAFVAMLALVLDGGLVYASRRQAQNAADAGALAGASELCATGIESTAIEVAESYAIDHNNAVDATATIEENKTVTVDAEVAYTTTFARIFNINSGTAAATASAACTAVCGGSGVLPIIWSCRAPVSEEESPTCKMEFGEENRYIIWDTLVYSDDTMCKSEGGSTECDLSVPQDGVDDLLSEKGGRSWLDLCQGDSTPCACNILQIVQGECPNTFAAAHMWFEGQRGVDASALILEDIVGKTFLIPIYDVLCTKDDATGCPYSLHSKDNLDSAGVNPGYAFHIKEMAAFHVSCIKAKPSEECPAASRFLELNTWVKETDYRSIEGYFVDNYSPDSLACNPGSGVIDVGNYTVTLLP